MAEERNGRQAAAEQKNEGRAAADGARDYMQAIDKKNFMKTVIQELNKHNGTRQLWNKPMTLNEAKRKVDDFFEERLAQECNILKTQGFQVEDVVHMETTHLLGVRQTLKTDIERMPWKRELQFDPINPRDSMAKQIHDMPKGMTEMKQAVKSIMEQTDENTASYNEARDMHDAITWIEDQLIKDIQDGNRDENNHGHAISAEHVYEDHNRGFRVNYNRIVQWANQLIADATKRGVDTSKKPRTEWQGPGENKLNVLQSMTQAEKHPRTIEKIASRIITLNQEASALQVAEFIQQLCKLAQSLDAQTQNSVIAELKSRLPMGAAFVTADVENATGTKEFVNSLWATFSKSEAQEALNLQRENNLKKAGTCIAKLNKLRQEIELKNELKAESKAKEPRDFGKITKLDNRQLLKTMANGLPQGPAKTSILQSMATLGAEENMTNERLSTIIKAADSIQDAENRTNKRRTQEDEKGEQNKAPRLLAMDAQPKEDGWCKLPHKNMSYHKVSECKGVGFNIHKQRMGQPQGPPRTTPFIHPQRAGQITQPPPQLSGPPPAWPQPYTQQVQQPLYAMGQPTAPPTQQPLYAHYGMAGNGQQGQVLQLPQVTYLPAPIEAQQASNVGYMQSSNSSVQCYNCGKQGHISRFCQAAQRR